jgi:hypothetical protein
VWGWRFLMTAGLLWLLAVLAPQREVAEPVDSQP